MSKQKKKYLIKYYTNIIIRVLYFMNVYVVFAYIVKIKLFKIYDYYIRYNIFFSSFYTLIFIFKDFLLLDL